MEKDYLNNTSKWCLVDDTILNLKKWITDWTLILMDAEDEYRRLIREEKHKEAMDFSWEMILSEIENDKKIKLQKIENLQFLVRLFGI
ncbi:MAG: hypothetical protein ACD_4C00007G0003 [uncultured bacterium (gcode 4)]|uniref:Uncharacterized protein n=1 Tax=uncultured bacterium (gcode 4) TaxID=1234023 RepID=K2GAP2_9BACT|nr:MAG: hypothetical protein ACD_4C00007G0003 [uncultured bacterium (gcode 4)]